MSSKSRNFLEISTSSMPALHGQCPCLLSGIRMAAISSLISVHAHRTLTHRVFPAARAQGNPVLSNTADASIVASTKPSGPVSGRCAGRDSSESASNLGRRAV